MCDACLFFALHTLLLCVVCGASRDIGGVQRRRSTSSRKKEDGGRPQSQNEKMEVDLHNKKRRWRWTSIKTVEEGDGPPSEQQEKEVDIRHHKTRPPCFTNRIMIVGSCSSAEIVPSVNVS